MLPMKLEHFMQEPVIIDLDEDQTIDHAAKAIKQGKRGSALLVKKEKLVGIITEQDILYKVVAEGLDPAKTKITDIMTPNPQTLSGNATAIEALKTMQNKGFRRIPVMKDNTIVGIISLTELYAAFKESLERDLEEQTAYVMGSGYSK